MFGFISLQRIIAQFILPRCQNWWNGTNEDNNDVSKLLSIPNLSVELSQIAENE